MIKLFLAIISVAAISGCTSSKAFKEKLDGNLVEHLNKYKTYPLGPRLAGLGGINRLRFVVDASGNVLFYELVQSSGNAELDMATLETIRRAQPLPPPPSELMKNGRIEIIAPFIYSTTKPI